LNNAQCGETIELQAGATFAGLYNFPAKNCDDNHWIIVRTSAPDSALPAEGQRMTPCYAGLASLPNRPAYPCPNPQYVLATISYSVPLESSPVVFASGANHYRLLGLEITRPQDGNPIVALVSPATSQSASYLILDRCWIHGTAQDETRRGVELDGTTNAAIVDSYLNDFHCTTASLTCMDSQAIFGGTGNNLSGPWKIQDDFLEAAAESILLGGGPATIVPTDITVSQNHFYKVPQWQPGVPGFVGGFGGYPFIVKNHFEIKNASRVLVEANLFEYCWGGFSQAGYSILVTPRNDRNKQTGVGNLCSVCEGTDVTVRYNKISHVGAGLTVAAVAVKHRGAAAVGRISVHDDVFDDIDANTYRGAGDLALIMNGWPDHVLREVSIQHITGFPSPNLMFISNSLFHPEMSGFTFSNNIVTAGQYPIWPVGKRDDCSKSAVPKTVLTRCFTTFSFASNVVAAASTNYPPDKWPAQNMFPATVADIGFVNFNNGNGGDYHLLPTSPYKGKASDGRDPGADIDAVNAAIQGVD